ncbi:uncharacterized protein LOC124648961 isoform X2 [Lolium rigidum]|nr:uncharacterized protein LOC124648961 isoform X2 [Lolium rigidum]XP_047044601.1 uncharacterized protein LOC124648961 isoform X2 [Lolium rigidum]
MAAAAESGTGEPATNGDKPEEEPQQFDPSRMIGVIKRKALIKELAAAYHAECVALAVAELLQLQKKWEEEQLVEAKMPEELKISSAKPSKRRKR